MEQIVKCVCNAGDGMLYGVLYDRFYTHYVSEI
jgi:hypothetical protein